MRRILSALVLVVFAVVSAQAAVTVGTFGNQNSSKEYRQTVNSDGTITYASDTSIVYPYKEITGDTTLTVTDSGKLIAYTGSDVGYTITLPGASEGYMFSFVTLTAGTMTIDPAVDDTIYLNEGMDIGDKIVSSGDAGDSVTIFAPTDTDWAVLSVVGTFSDGGA